MNFKEFKVKYKDEGNGTIEGYASTWVREPDSYGDIVKQGAFSRTLKEWEESGRPIPFLWAHSMNDLNAFIGSAKADEDDYGLHFIAEFDGTPEAQRVRELYKDGRLSKFSFAYDTLDQATVTLEDGRKANELRDLTIYEISAVTVPANDTAEVIAVKGITLEPNGLKIGDAVTLTPNILKVGDLSITTEGITASKGTITIDEEGVWSFKAGRRNSAKDEDAIRQAITLLQNVLDTVETEEGEDEPEVNAAAEEQKESNPEKAKLLEYIKSIKEANDEP